MFLVFFERAIFHFFSVRFFFGPVFSFAPHTHAPRPPHAADIERSIKTKQQLLQWQQRQQQHDDDDDEER